MKRKSEIGERRGRRIKIREYARKEKGGDGKREIRKSENEKGK